MEKQYSDIRKENDKNRLKENISTKIMTSTIFALAELEREIGWIWGHGLNYNELTEEQKVLRDQWNSARNNILTNGNCQRKNAMTEIDCHEILYRGFTTHFVMRNKDVNGNRKELYNNGEN